MQSIKTICGLCHTGCGMIVDIEDGVIKRFRGDPDHPANKGILCPKGAASIDIVYSKDRLNSPLIKSKNGFKKISWDDALNFAADKLGELRTKQGPQSLIRFAGAPVSYDGRDSFMQFMAAYGSPNFAGVGHLCHVPRITAMKTVFGGPPEPDYTNTKLILFWGTNPMGSTRFGNYAVEGDLGNYRTVIDEAKKKGIITIAIDPVRSETAELCDQWIPINPGTDLALALAMLHVIVKDYLYDKDFVDNWTYGFDDLCAHVSDCSPEWAASKTGIPALTITQLAKLYATTKPALLRDGNGHDMNNNGAQTIRALMFLIGITGNYDVPGGNVVFPWTKQSFVVDHSKVKFTTKRIGQDTFPLFPEIPGPALTNELLTNGNKYALIVTHSNPTLVMADTEKVKKAFSNASFLMVMDMFPTATTELADLILPSPSLFESYGYRAYSSRKGGFVSLKPKVVEPLGESRHFSAVEYDLAERMGISSEYKFRDDKEWVNYMLFPTGLTVDDFNEKTFIYTTKPFEAKKYFKNGFKTPSGKMEIFSQTLARYGQEPLPKYVEPRVVINSPSGEENEYPLMATTRKPYEYVHTKFRNIGFLKKKYPEPLVYISKDDAEKYSLNDKEKVEIRSQKGKMIAHVVVSGKARKGLIVVDYGWGNPGDDKYTSVNNLCASDSWDPISGGTLNRQFKCCLRKTQ